MKYLTVQEVACIGPESCGSRLDPLMEELLELAATDTAIADPDLAAELAMRDVATWEPYTDAHIHRVNANWKVTLDTFRENYHFDYLHRTTLKDYAYGGVLTFDAFGPHLRNCSAIRSIDELRGREVDDSFLEAEYPVDAQIALSKEIVELFAERAGEYQATVVRASAADLRSTLADLAGGRRPAVPADLPAPWRPEGAELVSDGTGDSPLSAHDLDGLDGALTGCALAIAETGTIVRTTRPSRFSPRCSSRSRKPRVAMKPADSLQ